MPQFVSGPAVRVIPNDRVEFQWSADVAWRAFVEVFNNANATGTLVVKVDSVDGAGAPVIGTDHLVKIGVGLVPPNTALFFRITMTDPTNTTPIPLVTQTPLPPFFTGAQSIGDVFADTEVDRAVISWSANVIGFGRVEYGTVSPGDTGTVQDPYNIPDHSIELTGLSPGTTYQFRVSNRHAIDQGSLAEKTGSFTTKPGVASSVSLTTPLARPRVILPGERSLLSVVAPNQDPRSPTSLCDSRSCTARPAAMPSAMRVAKPRSGCKGSPGDCCRSRPPRPIRETEWSFPWWSGGPESRRRCSDATP